MSEVIDGAVMGKFEAAEDAVPERTAMAAMPEFTSKAAGMVTVREVAVTAVGVSV